MLLLIFILGILIRFLAIYPAQVIIGFDQARDLFDAQKIIAGDLRIIGPTAGNNPNLHHGVAFLYTLIPPLLLNKNPFYPALWLSLVNAGAIVVLYFLAKSLFKSARAGLVAAFLASISHYFISYSGWISNPGPTLLTVPLFFYGIWKYSKSPASPAGGWGLPLASFFLGLTIQYELFFLYLIPTGLIIWLIFRLKFPNFKNLAFAFLAFCISASTMIAAEIKYGFAGAKSLLTAGESVGGAQRLDFVSQFVQRFFTTFSETLLPTWPKAGIFIGLLAILLLIYRKQWFVLVYLFSPAIMLLLGYHNAPWFLIGLPPAIILTAAFLLTKIKSNLLLLAVLAFLAFANLTAKGELLGPDKSALLAKQIAAMEYTYQKAGGQAFAIDTVTNPLYINAVWAWNYNWYAQKFGYEPTWLGGDQLPPYNTLDKATGTEKYLFLIIDETPRIPYPHVLSAIATMEKKGKLVEEKEFDGIKVMMFEKTTKKLSNFK